MNKYKYIEFQWVDRRGRKHHSTVIENYSHVITKLPNAEVVREYMWDGKTFHKCIYGDETTCGPDDTHSDGCPYGTPVTESLP